MAVSVLPNAVKKPIHTCKTPYKSKKHSADNIFSFFIFNL